MTLRSLRSAQRSLRLRAFDRRVRKGLAEFAEKTEQLKEAAGAASKSEDKIRLDRGHVLRLPSLGSFNDVELDRLSFFQAAEALILDGGVVDENVFSVLAADEAVTFGVVEPLHCSLFHSVALIFLLDLLNRNGKGCCRKVELAVLFLLPTTLPSSSGNI